MSAGEAVHFCGLIPGGPGDETVLTEQLQTLLRPVAHGFGGLAAGADIVVAEALLALGAQVTAVLPFPPDQYRAQSVLPGGADWVPRYERCLRQVELHVLSAGFTDDLDYTLGSSRAMGLARLQGGPSRQIAIWDGAGAGPAGTAADVQRWRGAGGETVVLPSPWPRRVRAAGTVGQPVRLARSRLWASPSGPGKVTVQEFDDPAEAVRSAFALAADPTLRIVLDYVPSDSQAAPATSDMGHCGIIATEAFACELALWNGTPEWMLSKGATYALSPPQA